MTDYGDYDLADWLAQARGMISIHSDLGLAAIAKPREAFSPAPGDYPPETTAGQDAGKSTQQPGRLTGGSEKATDMAKKTQSNQSLEQIRAEMGDCRLCRLHEDRANIVFGVGNPKARLMFVGEGPGRDEDKQGEPFVGRAGQLLTKIINAMGLERSDVYIANIVKCRPPKNRDPAVDEVEACRGFLEAQIKAIAPEIIVCLGSPSTKTLLNTTEAISRLRGKFSDAFGAKVMPTYHPAYLLRNPSAKRVVWDDMKIVMTALGLAAPK